ncbi:DUF2470 domain-containing protein [Pseudonocardia abyssalis]|uniref:DUF2470 domain-containing protein n=1 Tax=Pseudonocardia abyssalis TaxID=2792008 RepID=A0ABS6UQW7_9PSEU|nr:DUF2470 domain-containing protein [Pseudonocardia abyssalis]MBW0114953.1 hypothetical protein [Pseudonocardia abyssalis]MBW0134622.1 hypothetical protein [Pseudonocardia abyssalis]
MRSPSRRSGPGTAEIARTVLGHAPLLDVGCGADVEVVDVRGIGDDGSLVLLVGAEGPLARRLCEDSRTDDVCTVRAALLSPIAGPDRVLHTLTLHGRLEPAAEVEPALDAVLRSHPDRSAEVVLRPDASALLRVRPLHLELDGELVDPAALAEAPDDPIAHGSDEFVSHLLHDHPDAVVRLALLLRPVVLATARAIAPVRVDRHGLTLRVDSPVCSEYLRLDFPAALRGPADLPAAIRELRRRAAQVSACPISPDAIKERP